MTGEKFDVENLVVYAVEGLCDIYYIWILKLWEMLNLMYIMSAVHINSPFQTIDLLLKC
jgi:hypothetical protein